jgi:hypothetical protein
VRSSQTKPADRIWSIREDQSQIVAEAGLETSQELPGNSTVSWQGDSLSDSRLDKLIELWPALANDVKAKILTIAGLDVHDFDDVTTEPTPLATIGYRDNIDIDTTSRFPVF